jgi:Protein of unknown function (DUF2370)
MSGQYQRVDGAEATAPPTIVFDTSDALDDGANRPYQEGARSRLLDAFGSDSEDDSEGGLDDWQDDRNVTDADDGLNQQHAEMEPNVPPPVTGYSVRTSGMGSSLRNFFGWRRQASVQTGSSTNNDGVFANIVAKPAANVKPTEDHPPTYAEAAADAAPPYWETTIMAPGLSDELFIEGLPVGSPINFAWNFMVSAAFQFVGFFLTYLLHTSHAAKHGSRAGLGFTLLQCGWYLKPDPVLSEPTGGPPSQLEPTDPNDFDVSGQDSAGLGTSSFSQGHVVTTVPSVGDSDSSATGWIATVLMVIGVIIMVKAIADYLQARRMEFGILRSQPESETEEPEPEVAAPVAAEVSAEEMV